jgi:hypothetical protein
VAHVTEAGVWVKPISYIVCAIPETVQDWDLFAITVERTAPGRWAVRRRHRCLGVDGLWDWEPVPSERELDWLADHRFDLDTALRLAKDAALKITVNGWDVQRALAEWR